MSHYESEYRSAWGKRIYRWEKENKFVNSAKRVSKFVKKVETFQFKYFGCAEIPPSPLNDLFNNSALKIAFRPESYFVFVPQTS
jgi:hypothetical protein